MTCRLSPRWLPCAAALAILSISTAGNTRPPSRAEAARAAIHPVADQPSLRHWLARVPVTRDFPPDIAETLKDGAGHHIVEMSTAPGCLPCDDLWATLSALGRRHGWTVRTIDPGEAILRSGRLGIPWVGHPVAWVRQLNDDRRAIPIAIGTDHAPNLARNLYLGTKMFAGVRPQVGLRAMAKFTGIVSARHSTLTSKDRAR